MTNLRTAFYVGCDEKNWMEKSRASSENKNELPWEAKKKETKKKCRIILLPSDEISPFNAVEEKATYMQNIIRKVERLKRGYRHVCRANNEISRAFLPPRDCERILIIIFGNNAENCD